MTFKFFLIPALVLSILYGFAMASMASAETHTVTVYVPGWEAECALVDGMVECDISSEHGVENVHVFMNAGIGPVTVLDQDYEECPTDVHVSLDPIVLEEASEMQVTTCFEPVAQVCIAGECPTPTVEACIVGVTCKGEDAVGRPDQLPLKTRPAPSFVPIVLTDSEISPR
jgi:ABC-type thiamine transport system substrate-binding protein